LASTSTYAPGMLEGVRTVYVVNAYKQPELVGRLVDRIVTPTSGCMLHVDAKATGFDALLERYAGHPGVELLPRRPIYWAGGALLQLQVEAVRAALGYPEAEHVLYLTGQDYPLKPVEALHAHLEAHPGRSFLQGRPLPAADWADGGLPRYERYHWVVRGRPVVVPGPCPWPVRGVRRAWRITDRVPPRRMPDGLAPHGGSGVWGLTREAASYVVDLVARRPGVLRFFRKVWAPDEMFFQTVLMSSPLRDRIIHDDLHQIVWDDDGRGGTTPRTFTAEDLPALLASPKFFGRKFDAQVSAGVLDQLDAAARS
jgi:hypothetical protein